MNPRLVEELARQLHAELLAKAGAPRPDNLRKNRGLTVRSNVGWAIVAIGLRIAPGGS